MERTELLGTELPLISALFKCSRPRYSELTPVKPSWSIEDNWHPAVDVPSFEYRCVENNFYYILFLIIKTMYAHGRKFKKFSKEKDSTVIPLTTSVI